MTDERSVPLLVDSQGAAPPTGSVFSKSGDTPTPLNLNKALEEQADLSWIGKLRSESQLRTQAMVIKFMAERIGAAQVKMSSAAKGVHNGLCELCSLLRELDTVQRRLDAVKGGRKVEITHVFLKAVQSIDLLGNLPSKDTLDKFFQDLKFACHDEEVDTGKTKIRLKQLSQWQWDIAKDDDGIQTTRAEFEKDLAKRCQARDPALLMNTITEHINTTLEKLKTKYVQYGMFGWVLEVISEKVNSKNYQFFFVDFNPSELPKGYEQMQWAAMGEFIIEAMEDGCLTEDNVTCFIGEKAMAFRKGVRRIHSDVMPQFQLSLVEMESVMNSQIAESQQAKAKVLAGLVTVGISVGQIAAKALLVPHEEK